MQLKLSKFAAIAAGAAVVSGASLASEVECERAYVRAIDRAQIPDPLAALHQYESLRDSCIKDDPVYLSHLASLNNLAGRREIGEQIIEDGLKADPLNKNLLFSRSYIFFHRSDFVNGTLTAQKLMKEYPAWYGGYMAYQYALIAAGRFEESLDFGRKAIELSGGDVPFAFLNHAVANYYAGNKTACVEGVQAALQKDPSLVSERWGIDEGIFALGDLHRRQEAADLVRRRMVADPNWRNDTNIVRAANIMGLNK